MKYLTTFFILFLLTTCNCSDNNTSDEGNIKQDIVVGARLYDSLIDLKRKDTTVIWLGCGESGEISEQFIYQFNLADKKKFDSIKKNLTSDDKLNRIISALIIEELSKKKTVYITESDKKLIAEIKQLQSYYYLCQGCTGHYYGKISDLFENKNSGRIKEFIRWNIFKMKPWDK